MTALLDSPLFGLAVTVLVYALAQELYHRYPYFWLNPVLVSMVVLITGLTLGHVTYAQYNQGGQYITFFLGPAVVALGVPLYLQLAQLRREARAVLVATVAGSVTGILAGAGLAALLGATADVVLSLMPRSVTTPIAIVLATDLGGVPEVTAPLVVVSGIIGMAIGPWWLLRLGVRNPRAVGLALGTASHGIGTSRALAISEESGAYAGLAMCLCGIFTSLIVPWLKPALLWLAAHGLGH